MLSKKTSIKKIFKRPTTPNSKSSTFYVSKETMMTELKSYRKTKVISENLGRMFLEIAHRYTSRGNFVNYSYRQDMISEAVNRMVSQIDRFDIHHPSANPFAYFTQIAHNQIILFLNKEKKFRNVRSSLQDEVWKTFCHKENISFKEDNRTEHSEES